ncbi:MAG: nodulation protein NfeD [Chloroflexi bacterium]|nr:nodulation protein NfeD [Chloroflexota bacterium]
MARHILLVILLMLLGLLFVPPHAQADEAHILILEADGPIVPAMQNYIERGLKKAEDDNAVLIIIRLDTPGGSISTMEDIVKNIRDSRIPVVIYVAPRGAMAASAGTLITLAGHAAAMAPETVIGAASPINSDGSDLHETSDRKVKEVLTAMARTLAERRGPQAVDLAQRTITDAEAVSAGEALQVGLIDYIASDNRDLITQMDGTTLPDVRGKSITLDLTGLPIRTLHMSLIERLLLILTDPNIVFTLLSLGVILIILEMRAPGGWAAGTIGATCLVLSLYGLGVLPINWLGLVFVGLAFVLLVVEIITPHSFGALSTAAALSIAVGGLILFNNDNVRQFGKISIPILVGQSTLVAILGIVSVYFVMRVRHQPPLTGLAQMIGQVGEVRVALQPQGMVFVNGELWKAESNDGVAIAKGEPVQIVEIQELMLKVKPEGTRKKKEDG